MVSMPPYSVHRLRMMAVGAPIAGVAGDGGPVVGGAAPQAARTWHVLCLVLAPVVRAHVGQRGAGGQLQVLVQGEHEDDQGLHTPGLVNVEAGHGCARGGRVTAVPGRGEGRTAGGARCSARTLRALAPAIWCSTEVEMPMRTKGEMPRYLATAFCMACALLSSGPPGTGRTRKVREPAALWGASGSREDRTGPHEGGEDARSVELEGGNPAPRAVDKGLHGHGLVVESHLEEGVCGWGPKRPRGPRRGGVNGQACGMPRRGGHAGERTAVRLHVFLELHQKLAMELLFSAGDGLPQPWHPGRAL